MVRQTSRTNLPEKGKLPGYRQPIWFREDQSRARAGHAAENLATLRRLALNLLKREKTKKRGIKGKQLNAGWDHAYLLRLLGLQI